jgi:hypothetical protein
MGVIFQMDGPGNCHTIGMVKAGTGATLNSSE